MNTLRLGSISSVTLAFRSSSGSLVSPAAWSWMPPDSSM